MAISLKARALRYLSAREHSRLELQRKLEQYAQEGDDVPALLDALEQAKFLSSERFSESLVHRRSARYGNSRILAELQSHGINKDSLHDIKEQLVEDELARAQQLWLRKFGEVAQDADAKAKQMRFFMQRGFSSRTISKVLRGIEED
ncbi:MAG: recombination regulator RecX [Burkholderiales bacterium]|nr:recombination regulator RecX [Burkholderiales bacterium]